MCGSSTVQNGVCTVCGFSPRLKREYFSKKEWTKMVQRGMVLS